MYRSRERILLLLTFVVLCICCRNSTVSSSKQYEEKFIRNFDKIYTLSWKFSNNFAKPLFDTIVADLNISSVCLNVLRALVEHPEREWASLILDSSGHIIRPGFLSGTITDYGDYDQCMSIRDVPGLVSDSSENVAITGRYCLLTIRPPIPPLDVTLNYNDTTYQNSWPSRRFASPINRLYWRISSGVCFPTLCHESEVEKVFQKALEGFDLQQVALAACQTPDEKPKLDLVQKWSIIIIGVCACAVVIGTLVDYSIPSKKKNSPQIVSNQEANNNNNLDSKNPSKEEQHYLVTEFFISFSIIRNSQTLFAINNFGSKLTSIHGLRVLLMLWVILCHSSNFAPLGFYDQPMVAARFATDIKIVREVATQFVISGSLAVTGFFIISGLISLHTSLKYKENFSRNVPYWKYMLLRWLRFAPPLLGMFCYQFLWPLLGSGPLMHWDFLQYNLLPCYKVWWTNFAFVSNWLPVLQQCGMHTWYLSVDFQINLLAYFIILAYTRDYQLGLRLNWAAFGVSTIAPSLIHFYYRTPLVSILEPDFNKLQYVYSIVEMNTYNHFSAYFAGLLIAGLLNSEKKFTFSKFVRYILWFAALATVTLVPFSTYPFLQMNEIPVNFASLGYMGVKRFLFISALSWIIFASCSFSKDGLVPKFLSARIFQPFSRLTFCVYLTQSLVIWYYVYSNRSLHYINHFNTIFRIGGVILFSLAFGFILYALFEAPSVNLCKLAFKRNNKKVVTIQKKEVNEIATSSV